MTCARHCCSAPESHCSTPVVSSAYFARMSSHVQRIRACASTWRHFARRRCLSDMFDFFYKNRGQIASLTLEHLWLVGIAIVFALIIGVPLGILVSRSAWLRKPVLCGPSLLRNTPGLASVGLV